MTDILFYHLQRQPLERVLPTLLEKCRQRGWKVVVQATSKERVVALDDVLWTYSDQSFLPHGTIEAGSPERQPILLMTEDANPNDADVRILVDGAEGPDLSGYQRAIILFDGNDPDALASARKHWATLKAADHSMTYWQQDETGRWGQKA